MKHELYTQVVIAQDLNEHDLKAGDVVTLIDIVNGQNQEQGVVLEVFNAAGQTIKVIIVPQSAIRPFRNNEVLTVRLYQPTVD